MVPREHSLTPALDVLARAAGHASFADLVNTARLNAEAEQPTIGCPS